MIFIDMSLELVFYHIGLLKLPRALCYIKTVFYLINLLVLIRKNVYYYYSANEN